MGAPGDRLVVPVISGVESDARAEVSIVTVGAAAAGVVLKACVATASPLARPVVAPVAAPDATLTVISPLAFAVGVTTRV